MSALSSTIRRMSEGWSAALRFKPGQAYLADREGVEMGEQKFAIAEIEPRGLDQHPRPVRPGVGSSDGHAGSSWSST